MKKAFLLLITASLFFFTSCEDSIKLEDVRVDLNGSWVRTAIFDGDSVVDQRDSITYMIDVDMRKRVKSYLATFRRFVMPDDEIATFANGVLTMPAGKTWADNIKDELHISGFFIDKDGEIRISDNMKIDKTQPARLECISTDKVKVYNLQDNWERENLSGVYERVKEVK